MVAYSFNLRFAADIVSGRKRQTIRLPRKRHARPGERLQLYTGMRTRRCALLRDDVTCVGVDEVLLDLRDLESAPRPADAATLARVVAAADLSLVANGIPIASAEDRDVFAADDGFAGWCIDQRDPIPPFAAMVMFWMGTHGAVRFEGVLIRWEVPS